MPQRIELILATEMAEYIGGAPRIRFDWEPNPPYDGHIIRDALLVYRSGDEFPLSKYGCSIQVIDYSDPSTNETDPANFEWVFELQHDFLNAGKRFQEWRCPKKDKQPLVIITADTY